MSPDSKNKQPSGKKTESLSTLGDALRQQNPNLARAFEVFQNRAEPANRLVEVFHDILPYDWKDLLLFEKGIELTSEGRFGESIAVFQQVIQKQPEAYPAYHMLGHVFGCQEQFKTEVEYYRKALRIRPDYPQAWINLGSAYWAQGKEKKAIEAFCQAARTLLILPWRTTG